MLTSSIPVDDRRSSRQSQQSRNFPTNSSTSVHSEHGVLPSVVRPYDSPSLSRTAFNNARFDQSPVFSYSGEHSNIGLPPSLWMSPVSSSNSTSCGVLNIPSIPTLPDSSSHRSNVVQSPISPVSASVDSKSSLLTEIFSDELFPSHSASLSPNATTPFTSPRVTGSPVLQSGDLDADPDKLAKEDPLAAQIWKMYTKTKASLPHAQRMENLTWRMMALALKKRKEDDGNKLSERDNVLSIKGSNVSSAQEPEPQHENGEPGQRGRRVDKGKARVRVVGFEGTSDEGIEETE